MKIPRIFHFLPFLSLIITLGLAVVAPLSATPEATFVSNITDGTTTLTVNFVHHPIRGANFQVQQQDATGALNAVAAPEARTYIGTVVGYPGAIACALKQPDGTLWQYVVFEAGDQWWADNGQVTGTRGSASFTPSWPTSPVVTPAQAATVDRVRAGDVIADIPFDVFTGRHNSNVNQAVYVTEYCLMQTNLVYLRDLGFLHRASRIVIRADQAQDPYATGDKLQTLRGQHSPFVDHEAFKFVVTNDTGSGAAYVGTVGDAWSGVSINGTDARGDAYIVWRHEVGHNHGALDGQGGYCENNTLLNANQVARLSGPEEAAMINARLNGTYYNATALEDLGTYSAFNLPPRASLDIAYSEPGLAVKIDVMGNDHDSNGEAISLVSFDATSAKGATITLSEGTGPGGSDELIYTGSSVYPSGVDSFQYRIQDSNGNQALGNVFVRMMPGELCVYWPFDESLGAQAPDIVQAANATLHNGASWIPGTINNAMSLNGVNQYAKAYVDVPETDTAVSMWFRTNQTSGGIYSVTNDSGGYDRGIYLDGGNIKARIWNEEIITSTGQNYADGQWHQLVHTFGGAEGGQKLYVDGVLVASGSKTQSDFTAQTSIHLGYAASSPVQYFTGELDDVRIWRRSLSAAEALALAERSGTASYPSPGIDNIVGGVTFNLDWLAPTGATSHDLYLGNSQEVLGATPASDAFKGNFTPGQLEVLDLDPGFYSWRVDSHRDTTVFRGPVWRFQYIGGTGNAPVNLNQIANWWVNANDSFFQSGVISGTGALTKTGPGTLVLTGDNTYSGATTVKSGILQIGDGGTTGSLGTGSVTIGSTLSFHRSDDITYSGLLNGTGDLVQHGPGNLILSGTGITYSGITTLSGGSLTLRATTSFNSAIQISGGQLVLDSTGDYVTLPGVISGIGPVQINGDNTSWIYMEADNTYTGGTTIHSGGRLLLGNNTASGSVVGDITNSGTLGLSRNDAWTFTNNIGGNGNLNLYSPGGNPVTLGGGSTISLGDINAHDNPGGIIADTTVNLTGNLNLARNSTLTIGSGADVTVAGGMTQVGNAYYNQMSTLKVTGGSLSFGGLVNDGWDGAYSVLQTGGSVTALGITGGNGGGTWPTNTYTLEGGTLTLGANGIGGPHWKWPWFGYNGNGLTMNLNLGGGTLAASADWSTHWGATLTGTNGDLTIAPNGNTITLNGPLSGSGGIDLTGTGTLLLTNDNTYTGTTTIGSGTILQLGNNTSTGSISGAIVNNGTLKLHRNSPWTFAGSITGNGALTLANTSANPITFTGGSLDLATLGTGAGSSTVFNDTTLNLAGDLNLPRNSTITIGSGSNVTVAGGMTQVGNAYHNQMSTLKVTGGSLSFGGLVNDGWDGAYSVLQTGGNVTAPGITGGNGGGTWPTNTYTLEGGTLTLGANGIGGPHWKWPWFGYNGNGLTMNLNLGGGTLAASADWTTRWGATLTGTNGGLTVAPDGHTIVFNGPVTGTGDISVTGSGALILAGANNYSGTTTIASTATFGGAGGMTGPVISNGNLAPGNNGTGILTVNNALTLAPDSSIAFEVSDCAGLPGVGYDKISVDSLNLTATSGNPVTIKVSALSLTRVPASESTIVLIESAAPIIGYDASKFVLDTTDFPQNLGSWTISHVGNNIELVHHFGSQGKWTHETYSNIGGSKISDFTGANGLLRFPDDLRLSDSTEVNHNTADDYGERFRASLTVPADGDYTFWVAGRNSAELWLSTDDRKFNKRKIAFIDDLVTTAATFQAWDLTASQKSATVALLAGQTYYIEILHKSSIGDDHVSVAWEGPGIAREQIPSSAITNFSMDSDDLDDDCLPDSWETAKGLSASDNGFADFGNGEFGDPDRDGLTNREEWLLGTDPLNEDTDGDTITDMEERDYYGTDPLTYDQLTPTLHTQVVLGAYESSSNAWETGTNGELISTERRGYIDYPFTVAVGEEGIYDIFITGGAAGQIRSVEELPLEISLNGVTLGKVKLRSENGASSTIALKRLLPWLSAGNYTLRIRNMNYRALLKLRLDSVEIYRLGGADADADGIADWAEQKLANENLVTRAPSESLTSPVTVEGITPNLAFFNLAKAITDELGQPSIENQEVLAGINGGFFSHVELNPQGATDLTFNFQNGVVAKQESITWKDTNILEHDTLTIRKGDALKLSAWDTSSTPSGTFTLSLDLNPSAAFPVNGSFEGHLPVSANAAVIGWTGLDLANLASVSGLMQGGWIPNATVASGHHLVITGSSATLQLQFFDGTYTKVAKIRLDQTTEGITAYQIYGRYKAGDHVGQDFDTIGSSNAVVGAGGYGVTRVALSSLHGVPSTTDLTSQGAQPSDQPLTVDFNIPGTHTLTSTWQPAGGGQPLTSTLVVTVKEADFGDTFDVLKWNPRTWSIPGVVSGMDVSADDDLVWEETTQSGQPFRNFRVNVSDTGVRHVLARMPETGEIIARGTVNGFHVAYADETSEVRLVQTFADGTRRYRVGIVVEGLPPNGEVRIHTLFQGITFPDGGNQMVLKASDFNNNGVAYFYIQYGPTGTPKTCHGINVFLTR